MIFGGDQQPLRYEGWHSLWLGGEDDLAPEDFSSQRTPLATKGGSSDQADERQYHHRYPLAV
jgi:hypothetical protein